MTLRPILLISFVSTAVLVTAAAGHTQRKATRPAPPPSDDTAGYSGQYEFLHRDEMLQLTVEPQQSAAEKKVTGFVSRHGELESDRGTPLDHWIHNGILRGDELHFRTTTIHGVWFEFSGRIVRGPARSRSERGEWVIQGKLTEHIIGPDRKDSAQSREVAFHALPDEDRQE